MKEIKKIVDIYSGLEGNALRAALATAVKVTGSSYRRAGARMVITNDGRWVGAINGGYLEGDALRKARAVIMEKKPAL